MTVNILYQLNIGNLRSVTAKFGNFINIIENAGVVGADMNIMFNLLA